MSNESAKRAPTRRRAPNLEPGPTAPAVAPLAPPRANLSSVASRVRIAALALAVFSLVSALQIACGDEHDEFDTGVSTTVPGAGRGSGGYGGSAAGAGGGSYGGYGAYGP